MSRRLPPLALSCLVALVLACEKPAPPAQAPQAPQAPVSGPDAAPDATAPSAAPAPGLTAPTAAQRDLLARAKVFLLAEDLAHAEPLFEELSETGPWSGERVSGAIALGDIYLQTGRPELALELYEGLLKQTPDLPEVHLVVGRALAQMGKQEEAILVLRRVLELQPLYLFVWVELGGLYQAMGKAQQSSEALLEYERKLYAMAKELESPLTPLAARLNGIEAFGMLEDDKATQTLVRIMRAAPEPQVRQAAAIALADARAIEALADLRAVAKGDQNQGVKAAALQSVGELEKLLAPPTPLEKGP